MQTVSTTIEFAPEAMTSGDPNALPRTRRHRPVSAGDGTDHLASRVKRMAIVEAVGER